MGRELKFTIQRGKVITWRGRLTTWPWRLTSLLVSQVDGSFGSSLMSMLVMEIGLVLAIVIDNFTDKMMHLQNFIILSYYHVVN